MVTVDAHRGKGYAVSVCSALIDYCLDHDLEPVLACRLENEGSYYLAQKLGFRPSVTLPYYRLLARDQPGSEQIHISKLRVRIINK